MSAGNSLGTSEIKTAKLLSSLIDWTDGESLAPVGRPNR